MPDPKDIIEQLRRSNRRWKALALAACAALVLVALVGFVANLRERMLQDLRTQHLFELRTERGQR
jgi:ferric-dicitrate binding protein FerR (iron transport regulator)